MVNSKNVAFKVNKQTPFTQTIEGAYGTVINCRISTAKSRSADKQEPPQWRSHDVPLSNVPGARKRKWHNDNDKEKGDESRTATPPTQASATPPPASTAPSSTALLNQQWVQRKPTRLRKGKHLLKGVDLDCWFNIYSFTDPAQLLDMRTKIATCFRFLRDNPMLWKHSREYNFGPDMPDPPPELTEFQFAHLRHGHGCMSCHAPNTRKTYWPFLRRWCKPCLHSKCIKAQEAYALLRGSNGDDLSWLYRAIPSGVFDSWGNFTGVGPASTHSLKTVYLASDLHELVAEYETYRPSQNPDQTPEEVKAQHDRMHKWLGAKIELAEQRRAFAKKMETWEENARNSKSYDYQARKAARKEYFKEKAQQLNPPIPPKELENCASFKRAILIPKEPNNISWLQLKPKLEREAAANLAKANNKNSTANLPSTSHGPTTSTATTSRASSHLEIQPPYLPPPNVDFSGLTLPRPRWQG